MNAYARVVLAAVLSVGAATAVTACADDGSGAADGEVSLHIGALVPLTGDLSDFGPSMQRSSELALQQINAAIEEAGLDHSVKLNSADTQGQPQAAVQAARSLVADGANCLAGPAASSETIPVARSVAIRDRVPLVSSVATSEDLTKLEDDGLVSRVMITDRYQGQALVDAMGKYDLDGQVEGKVAAVAARNDAYGTGVVEFFREAWEAAGGEVGTEILFDPEQASYNSEAQELTSGDADVTLLVSFPEEFLRLGAALARTRKWDPADTWGISLLSDNLPKEAGAELTEGLSDAGQGTPDDADAYRTFKALYKDAGGPPGQAFDPHQFDATMLCYLAAAAAGSTEPDAIVDQLSRVSSPPGDKFTWKELPEAVEALANGDDINYEGASGPIDLDENGDPTAGVFDIFTIKDGKYVPRGEILIDGDGQ